MGVKVSIVAVILMKTSPASNGFVISTDMIFGSDSLIVRLAGGVGAPGPLYGANVRSITPVAH